MPHLLNHPTAAPVVTGTVDGSALQPTAAQERRRIRSSTAAVAALTLISRISGLVREMVVVAIFGISPVLSAFTVAYQIPSLIRNFVADTALHSAIVPVFTELDETGESDRAWRLVSSVMWLILLVLTPVCVLCYLAAPAIIGFTVSDSFPETALAVDLFRIMLPTVVLLGVSGVIVSVLHSFNHFSTPALAPIAWNVVVVAAALTAAQLTSGDGRIIAIAAAVVVATLVQLAIPIPWLRGRGGRVQLTIAWRDPALRGMLAMMLPITITLALINLNVLVNTFFSTHVPNDMVPAGAGPAAMDKAYRIYMLPQGIFSLAVATVFFPAMTRYIARDDVVAFRQTVADALRHLFVLLLPTTALLMVFAGPVVQLLYQRGSFTPDQTPIVGGALAGFAIGLVFNGATLFLIRAFFSLKRPIVPMMVGVLSFGSNALLAWLLHEPYGLFGIATATSISSFLVFSAMYWLLRRRVGHLHTLRSLSAFVVSAIASALMAGVAHVVWTALEETGLPARGLVGLMLSLAATFTAAGLVYAVIAVKSGLISRATVKQFTRRAG